MKAKHLITARTINRQKIQQHLHDFDFKAIFVDELGWDILKEPPQPLPIGEAVYVLQPLVEKRGVKVFLCGPDVNGQIPADGLLHKIEYEVTNQAAYEHFIIYIDADKKRQLWQWVKRDHGKRPTSRINRYRKGQSGELLAQKLERLAVRIDEEEHLRMADVTERVAKAFDVERVTKKFYDRFKLEHTAFLELIRGLETQADREWYASLLLNRLMFTYFIQRKGFLDTKEPGQLDGDPNYLSNRLKRIQQKPGENQTVGRLYLVDAQRTPFRRRSKGLERVECPISGVACFFLHLCFFGATQAGGATL